MTGMHAERVVPPHDTAQTCLAKLESNEAKSAAKKTTAKKSETKTTPTAKKSTTTKEAADKAPSPAPGRSIGGGSGRGSSAS